MAEERDLSKLFSDIKRFLDVYQILSPESKAAFEAQMTSLVEKSDERSRNLYTALLQAAKDGRSPEEAVDFMKKSTNKG